MYEASFGAIRVDFVDTKRRRSGAPAARYFFRTGADGLLTDASKDMEGDVCRQYLLSGFQIMVPTEKLELVSSLPGFEEITGTVRYEGMLWKIGKRAV